MTFQEKYAKKREKTQKVLIDAINQANVETCANAIIKVICEEFDTLLSGAVERMLYWGQTFSVQVVFSDNHVFIEDKKIELPFTLALEAKVVKIINKKLHNLGIDFCPDDDTPDKFFAVLKFTA